METTSLKALALAVLERNQPGNLKETSSFLDGKQEETKSFLVSLPIGGNRETSCLYPHRQEITYSELRPQSFETLPEDVKDLWCGIVYGSMIDAGRPRQDAEAIAWRDIDKIKKGEYESC